MKDLKTKRSSVVASAVLSRNELLYVGASESANQPMANCRWLIVLWKLNCRASVSDASLQRFASALASLPKQRNRQCGSSASPTRTSGDNSAAAPPVPIPNTEVKRCSPDGSTATGRARVGRRQNRAPSMSRDVLGVLFWRRLLEQRTERLGTAR